MSTTQFKKPTSLSESFKGYYSDSDNQWVADFLNSDQSYAVSNSEGVVRYLRIILKDSSFYSIPYSLLPVLIYTGERLILKCYGIHISIYGKGLSIIEGYISNQTLLYVRESITGIDITDQSVFISSINVQGKNVSTEISEEEM